MDEVMLRDEVMLLTCQDKKRHPGYIFLAFGPVEIVAHLRQFHPEAFAQDEKTQTAERLEDFWKYRASGALENG